MSFSAQITSILNKLQTLVNSAFSGDYNDLANKPSLFSGSYNDLTDKPSQQDISTKANLPQQITSYSSNEVTLADNTEYRFTGVSTLTVRLPQNVPAYECWMKLTTASSGDISITISPSPSYIGSTPLFDVGSTYELSFKDNVCIVQEVSS